MQRYNLNNVNNLKLLKVNNFYEYHRIILTPLNRIFKTEKKEVGVYVIKIIYIDFIKDFALVQILMASEVNEILHSQKQLSKSVGTKTRLYFKDAFDSYLIDMN